jgi:hypothetical protein
VTEPPAPTRKATTKEWFSTAKNYATFSNVGGLYDLLVADLALRR